MILKLQLVYMLGHFNFYRSPQLAAKLNIIRYAERTYHPFIFRSSNLEKFQIGYVQQIYSLLQIRQQNSQMKDSSFLSHLSVFDQKVAGIQDCIHKGSVGRFKLWYDPVLKRQYEEYLVEVETTKKDFEIYQFRRDQWQNLISIYHVRRNQAQRSHQLSIFTERIPVLLNEILTVNFQQAMYILKQSLIGFQTIFQRFGFVNVQDRMIGISQQGKIRVWLNPKYEYNTPYLNGSSMGSLNPNQLEEEMVKNIFLSIEKHTENGKQMTQFQIARPTNINFQKAINYVLEYIHKNKIALPSSLKYFIQTFSAIKRTKTNTTEILNSNEVLHQEYLLKNSNKNKCQPFVLQSNLRSNPNSLLGLNSYKNNLQESEFYTFEQASIRHTIDFIPQNYKIEGRSNNHWRQTKSKKTKYFGTQTQTERILSSKSKSKSKEKIIVKSSWNSKDMSFKSTTYSNQNQRKIFPKANHLLKNQNLERRMYNYNENNYQSSSSKNDESFMTQNNFNRNLLGNIDQRPKSFFFPSDYFHTTKSVVVNNKVNRDQNLRKQFVNPENSNQYFLGQKHTKNLVINTEFNLSSSYDNQGPGVSVVPNVQKFKNLSSMTQFKAIKKSVIRESTQPQVFNKNGLLMISKLKSSYFNKLDDLKQSQIISEHFNQASQLDSNIDVSSPLLQKTRASAIRRTSPDKILGLTRCRQTTVQNERHQTMNYERFNYQSPKLSNYGCFLPKEGGCSNLMS